MMILLKEIYDKSFISLIPLKDSLQPSGQSVALQSMSMMVPVIITKTVGFWDTIISNMVKISIL